MNLLIHVVAVMAVFSAGYWVGKYESIKVQAILKEDFAKLEAKAVILEANAKNWVMAELAKIKLKIKL